MANSDVGLRIKSLVFPSLTIIDMKFNDSTTSKPVFLGLVEMFAERLDSVFSIAFVIRPCRRAQAFESLKESRVHAAERKAGTSNAEILHQPQVLDLVAHELFIKQPSFLVVVWLNAADV